jgi:hypothetical protein
MVMMMVARLVLCNHDEGLYHHCSIISSWRNKLSWTKALNLKDDLGNAARPTFEYL